jgi:hypothetical protein
MLRSIRELPCAARRPASTPCTTLALALACDPALKEQIGDVPPALRQAAEALPLAEAEATFQKAIDACRARLGGAA